MAGPSGAAVVSVPVQAVSLLKSELGMATPHTNAHVVAARARFAGHLVGSRVGFSGS